MSHCGNSHALLLGSDHRAIKIVNILVLTKTYFNYDVTEGELHAPKLRAVDLGKRKILLHLDHGA